MRFLARGLALFVGGFLLAQLPVAAFVGPGWVLAAIGIAVAVVDLAVGPARSARGVR